MKRSTLVVAWLAACGGAPPPAGPSPIASTPITIPSVAPTASVPEPVDAAAPPLALAAIDPPNEARCTWSTEKSMEAYPLRVKPGAAPIVRAIAPRVRAKLLRAGGLFVELASPELRAKGYVDVADATLRPARAITFSGFVIAAPMAKLTMSSNEAGVAIALPARAEIVPVVPLVPTALECADVALAWTQFDPRAALPKPMPGTFEMPARAVPLAMTPGGTAVARVAAGSGRVSVLERRGAHARVVVDLDDRLVVGWVAGSDVRAVIKKDDQGRFGILGALGSGVDAALIGSLDARAPTCAPKRCTSDVRMVVELDGARWALGAIAPDASFCTNEGDGDLTPIEPPSGITAMPGARIFAPTSELTACAAR